MGSGRQTKFALKAAIDDDSFSKIKDEFVNSPIWWDFPG